MWLDRLKVAVAQKDTKLLEELMSSLPQLDAQDAQSAVVLLEQAKQIVQDLQEQTAESMLQLQKQKEFLCSTSEKRSGNFDITS